jgi:acetolactate synthase I/II/III large subunit
VVLADSKLSLIKVKQERKKIKQYAVHVNDGKFFNADYFLGVPVLSVTDKKRLKSVFEKAFSCSGPVIIEAVVDGSIYEKMIAKKYK